MLGWHVCVMKADDVGADYSRSADASELCSWSTGLHGTGWIERLLELEKAKDLGGNGYPNRFLVRARDLRDALPEDQKINARPLQGLDADDLLVIEAWDQS